MRFNLERHCTENCTADCTTPAERCTENCTIDTIRLVGLRGGSGTSTIAAVLAMHAATMVNTELVSSDAAHMSALLGLGPHTGRPSEVMENLVLTNQPSTNGMMVIIDGGTLDPTQDSPGSKPGERRIGVLRGPCYLALRTLMAAPHGLDGLIVVSEFGRALNERDVADVTGLDVVATVAATPTVSRTIDAGLLTRRYRNLPDLRPLRRWLTLQLDPFPARPDPRRAAPNHPSMSGTDLPLPPGGERGCVRTAVLVDLASSSGDGNTSRLRVGLHRSEREQANCPQYPQPSTSGDRTQHASRTVDRARTRRDPRWNRTRRIRLRHRPAPRPTSVHDRP
ncbi:MAG: hypothetical protein V9E94_03655 [Microthrixaceae bacterium]